MRRSVQPNCPRAMTCCFFASLKILAMSAEGLTAPPPRQRLERLLPMAGFQVSSYGRFWVSTEVHRSCNERLKVSSGIDSRCGIDPHVGYLLVVVSRALVESDGIARGDSPSPQRSPEGRWSAPQSSAQREELSPSCSVGTRLGCASRVLNAARCWNRRTNTVSASPQNPAPYTPRVCDTHTEARGLPPSSMTRSPLRPDELLGFRLAQLTRRLLEY